MLLKHIFQISILFLLIVILPAQSADEQQLKPLFEVVDLDIGEAMEVDVQGEQANIKVLKVEELRDRLNFSVRRANVLVEVNGAQEELISGTYNLPVSVGGFQIDCPITQGYLSNASNDSWGLQKDVRIRIWSEDSPWIRTDEFEYPARQQWFASMTQMANEPVYVDGGDTPGERKVYYHSGLDIGGAEGMVDVVAATDGIVMSSGTDALPDLEDTPVRPRYDVVYVRDARGWYYRYSHLLRIDETIRPGVQIRKGNPIGVLGKEGGSGGWAHLHFEIKSRQPSGLWGTQEAYAFLWQSYHDRYQPEVTAVARPHVLATPGEEVVLDGTRSRDLNGDDLTFEWQLSDGSRKEGATVIKTYSKPGMYSEILKATNPEGDFDYDFAVVQIVDPEASDDLPPSIHAAFSPTFDLRTGMPITFKTRSFRAGPGAEIWNFGDGSPPITVHSDGNEDQLNPDGYAVTEHSFDEPGDYLVKVEREDSKGRTATAHLHVRILD